MSHLHVDPSRETACACKKSCLAARRSVQSEIVSHALAKIDILSRCFAAFVCSLARALLVARAGTAAVWRHSLASDAWLHKWRGTFDI